MKKRERESFLILLYHRVHSRSQEFSIERTEPRAFEAQMEYLAREFHVLSLPEILSRLESGAGLPRRAIAVTFDDGYEDNYTHAFPILRSLGLPATIFLTTGWIGTDEVPWFDRVLHAFRHSTRLEIDLPGGDRAHLSDAASRQSAAIRSLYALMRLPNPDRVAWVERLVSDLSEGNTHPGPRNEMLRWDQVREMAAAGISFGAHTVSHPVLSRLPEPDVKRELLESKRRIESETGSPVPWFAYPVGRPEDLPPRISATLAECGYSCGLTTTWGPNQAGDDRFLLRRIKPRGNDLPSFALGLMLDNVTESRD